MTGAPGGGLVAVVTDLATLLAASKLPPGEVAVAPDVLGWPHHLQARPNPAQLACLAGHGLVPLRQAADRAHHGGPAAAFPGCTFRRRRSTGAYAAAERVPVLRAAADGLGIHDAASGRGTPP